MIPFTPAHTVMLPVAAASARVALPDQNGGQFSILISIAPGLDHAYIAFGDDTVVAEVPAGPTPANGMPIFAGAFQVFRVGPTMTHVAAITAAGTATLWATAGDGI